MATGDNDANDNSHQDGQQDTSRPGKRLQELGAHAKCDGETDRYQNDPLGLQEATVLGLAATVGQRQPLLG
jgi:hypothetical protein